MMKRRRTSTHMIRNNRLELHELVVVVDEGEDKSTQPPVLRTTLNECLCGTLMKRSSYSIPCLQDPTPRDMASEIHSGHIEQPNFSLQTLAIVIATLAAFVIIAVGIVMLHKCNRQEYQLAAVVDTHITPEEKHVANMQINGYENPTYKYFDTNGKLERS